MKQKILGETVYDAVVIGGGVIGCGIARELSKYKLSVALCEATCDVAMGASRANSGIVHAGYDASPNSKMAKMNVRGNELFTAWCDELSVPLKRCGSLVVGFNDSDTAMLEKLYGMGIKNGVPQIALIDGDEARRIEPALNPNVTRALYAPTAGITCPYEMTIAAFENALLNGATFFFNAPVTSIEKGQDNFTVFIGRESGFRALPSKKVPANFDGTLKARYVINAAGIHADDIARMIGDDSFTITPRKGEYMMLDRLYGSNGLRSLNTVIFQTPSPMGKGVLVSPTVDGNAFAGPTANDSADKSDKSTSSEGLKILAELAVKSVPGIDLRSVITSFAGVRAIGHSGGEFPEDFILRASQVDKRFIHIAGICSPGLSSMPAIAEEAVKLLNESGLDIIPNPYFEPYRQPITRFSELDWTERAALIEINPQYGRIVCRCETVSEAEISEAVRRGAITLDGVKRRTRAGMGRCQGGFCSPRVMEIISKEAKIPVVEITKFGGASKIVAGKLKEVFANVGD